MKLLLYKFNSKENQVSKSVFYLNTNNSLQLTSRLENDLKNLREYESATTMHLLALFLQKTFGLKTIADYVLFIAALIGILNIFGLI